MRERLVGRPRNRLENNISVDLKDIDVNARNWINSVLDGDYLKIVKATLNLRVV